MNGIDTVSSPAARVALDDRYFPQLMRRIERVDLLLQRRYYEQSQRPALDNFRLSEEEVEARIAAPQGAPLWAMQKRDSPPTLEPDIVTPDEADPFSRLTERFELTDFDANALLLGLLPHFDSRYHSLFAALSGDKQKKLPTFDLALTLFGDSPADKAARQASFLSQSPLLDHGLLQTVDRSENEIAIWGQTAFIAANEVFHHLFGNDCIPAELRACMEVVSCGDANTPASPVTSSLCCLGDMFASRRVPGRPVVMLSGREGSGRARVVAEAVAAAGGSTVVIDLARVPEDDEDASDMLLQAFRHARLQDACVVLRNFADFANARRAQWHAISLRIKQPGLFVVCLVEPHAPLAWLQGVPQVLLEMPVRSTEEKARLLSGHLEPFGADAFDTGALSRSFDFTAETLPSVIREASLYGRLRGSGNGFDQHDLRKALRLRSQQNFGKLAQRIEPKRSLEDLLVSNELRRQLGEITSAIKYREHALERGFADKIGYGTGISALFHGPSGTGKTMAAEVLAAQQGVDLVKIDLSTVVNKYIGETEKNLSRIFDLAEADAGVLFFDEADALFGKRSETKDAQDRHANIEVSYLLQRLESYPGLVILATNNRGHLDPAFSRRFTFITHFTYPDAALRERMWRTIWPRAIRLADNVDFAYLAKRADVTGANIRNVALLSTWLAADESDGTVQVAHIELALSRELAKVGRLML